MTSPQVYHEGHITEALVRTALEIELFPFNASRDDLPLAILLISVQVDDGPILKKANNRSVQ